MSLAILLLAAGSSRRMGSPKQLLPWGGTTLVGHAVRQALAVTDAVFVVLGANAELVVEELKGLKVSVIKHASHNEGLGSSLACGVAFVASDPHQFARVLVTLADQPAADAAYLLELCRTAELHPGRIIATAYGARPGVPALFPSAYYAELSALGGDAGAGRLLRAHPEAVMLVRPPQPIYDIDTPEDYRRHEGDQEHH